MKEIVGIICEYNPFHKGHLYQIEEIKKTLPNAKIVAIMSGNIVQRGEFAIIDKKTRAEIALKNGVDLVVEMPYPYCGATAEVFASAGVKIATQIGCTHLYFGTEKTDLQSLDYIAEIIDTKEIINLINEKLTLSKSYNEAKEKALLDKGIQMPKSPNDILGLEYIRAIKNQGACLKYCTIKRKGSGYSDQGISDIMSASAIRKYFYENSEFVSIPACTQELYKNISTENQVLDVKGMLNFLHRFALVVEREALDNAYDSCAEIGAIIKNSAENSKDGEEFISKLSSRAFTTSRMRRTLLFTLFKVKSADKCPKFVNLLATNTYGKKIIKQAKQGDFKIITKHSDTKTLDPVSKFNYDTTISVDKLYFTLLKSSINPSQAYKRKPIIM